MTRAPISRRNFIARNDAFTCEQCHYIVPPARGTFRNHCPQCLTSKHVDLIPGDRAASCGGLMPTVSYEGTDPQHLTLVQQCQRCSHTHRNRTAPDDNYAQLFD